LIRTLRFSRWLAAALILVPAGLCAQNRAARNSAELHLHIQPTPSTHRKIAAVVWLEPSGDTPVLSFNPQGHYTLLQKNRTFIPHLQVVPVGSVVQFPNADPFFHNVFSLFDGKRFDLGLYEAGSTKSVIFSRPGVSYIFCNIHPEMSAVVISLSTPLYATADAADNLTVRNIPPGDYVMRLWVEGALPPALQGLSREIKVGPGMNDLGNISVPISTNQTHTNEFGRTYDRQPTSPY
jgi:hypothetical protein